MTSQLLMYTLYLGKDSLYNEYRDTTTGEQRAIPSTLLISAICVMPDIEKRSRWM